MGASMAMRRPMSPLSVSGCIGEAGAASPCRPPRAAPAPHHGPFPGDRLPQGLLRLDLVAVAPAVLALDEIAGLAEVVDDPEGPPFRHAEHRSDVPQASS